VIPAPPVHVEQARAAIVRAFDPTWVRYCHRDYWRSASCMLRFHAADLVIAYVDGREEATPIYWTVRVRAHRKGGRWSFRYVRQKAGPEGPWALRVEPREGTRGVGATD
jgi:hypothetical protein